MTPPGIIQGEMHSGICCNVHSGTTPEKKWHCHSLGNTMTDPCLKCNGFYCSDVQKSLTFILALVMGQWILPYGISTNVLTDTGIRSVSKIRKILCTILGRKSLATLTQLLLRKSCLNASRRAKYQDYDITWMNITEHWKFTYRQLMYTQPGCCPDLRTWTHQIQFYYTVSWRSKLQELDISIPDVK